MKYIIGIDEVGRGPLAGPVTVCAFAVRVSDVGILPHRLKNSKALTSKARKKHWQEFRRLMKDGVVIYKICSVSEKIIDRKGIVHSINMAIEKSITRLNLNPEKVLVLLDGGIRAPKEYKNQKTIIKGDEKEPTIAAASIMAKVFRDKKMIKLAKDYPEYGFERHKGYGTRFHYEALSKHGPSMIHRRSFLSRK